MEEYIFSGYCRCLDQSRMVTMELEAGSPPEIDCLFPNCLYTDRCPIAEKIREQMNNT